MPACISAVCMKLGRCLPNDRNNSDRRSTAQLAVVDAHCHIDLYGDPHRVLTQTEQSGIHTIAVTNAPSVFHFTRDLAANCRFVRAAIGLHPELVQSHGHELAQFWPYLEQTRFVGEIGLDYVTPDAANRAQQRQVFDAIVQRCALLGNRVLTIHSRRSVSDVLSTLGSGFPGTAILHWFSGTTRQLEQAVDLGCFFSVNPSMTKSKNGIALTAAIPRHRILTETDGPFVKLKAGPAVPDDTSLVILALARTWGIEPSAVRDTVLSNARLALGF